MLLLRLVSTADSSFRLYLIHGIFYQEGKFLVPNWCSVTACMAGRVIPAASHGLLTQNQPAVRIALPRKAPHWQIPGLQQVDLRQAACISMGNIGQGIEG